jgi:hypothetical protein
MRRPSIVWLVALLTTGLCAAADRSVLVSDVNHRALGPEIALGRDGAVNVIWLDKGAIDAPADPAKTPKSTGEGHSHQSWTDLLFARSTDGGRTFSAPLRVNQEAGEIWGFAASKPRIGVGPTGTIHVYYPANENSPATGKPVAVSRYVRSTDQGKTFSKPVRLNTHATTDASAFVHGGLSHAHAFGTMSVARDGTIYTYWIDTRAMAKDGDNGMMYSAISNDDGVTFATDREAFPADICPCCQLSAVAIDRKVVFVGARRVYGDNLRDATVARSDDGGKTFGERVRLGGTPWKINGCPLKPTAIAVDGSFVYAAAHSGAEQPAGVYFARSRDGGKSFGDFQPMHPDATVSDAPAIAVSKERVIVAWHAKTNEGRRIYYRVSTDRGATFGAVRETDAPPGTSTHPALAVAADGAVHLVWQQGDAIHTTTLELPETRVASR